MRMHPGCMVTGPPRCRPAGAGRQPPEGPDTAGSGGDGGGEGGRVTSGGRPSTAARRAVENRSVRALGTAWCCWEVANTSRHMQGLLALLGTNSMAMGRRANFYLKLTHSLPKYARILLLIFRGAFSYFP